MDKVDVAELTLKNSLAVKRSDRVLVICDEETMEIGHAFFKGASRLCMSPILIEIRLGKHHGDEPPVEVARLMGSCDVVIAPTTYSLTYTNATREALGRGARIATMPGLTMEMLMSGSLNADYNRISKYIRKFSKIVSRAKSLRIISEEGTDISMSIDGREWITEDTGLCHRRGSITNLPAGEVFIAPKENTANGVIVIDGVFMESTVGKVILEVNDGTVNKISGPDEIRDMMMKGKCQRTLSEVGIGMNPNATIMWNILQDQKKMGTVHIGFGDNSTFGGSVRCDQHYDGLILHPTLTIGRRKIIENGNFKLEL
jgi:aminopeptidase